MNRKGKIGMVLGILLLAIMIPAAMSVGNIGNGNGSGNGNNGVGNGNNGGGNNGGGNVVGTPPVPTTQQITEANSLTAKILANSSKNAVTTVPNISPAANIVNPQYYIYQYSNGPYVFFTGIYDPYYYNFGYPSLIPIKAEVWDPSGAIVPGAIVYYYAYYYNNGWNYYSSNAQYQGYSSDNVHFSLSLPPGLTSSGSYTLWYILIEGYYYDSSGTFRYGYHYQYIYTY